MERATVLVAGLGDLGIRVATILARSKEIGQLVVAGRHPEIGRSVADQARLVAAVSGGAREVDFQPVDLEDRDQTAALVRRVNPDVLVISASRITWWRPMTVNPEGAVQLAGLPYGIWLPVHVALIRRIMEAVHLAGTVTLVVSLPFPDAVGPSLAPLGLAPHAGAGNVAEVAVKLGVLAAQRYKVARELVRVRLVMHHAAQRLAFASFASLGGRSGPEGEPPWLATIEVAGHQIPQDEVTTMFNAPYGLMEGRANQELTAAAAAELVSALLGNEARLLHVPAPGGLPGGYPVLVSQDGISLDLPTGTSIGTAVEVNEAAARWDGIERIEADGTIVFTDRVREAASIVLGMRLSRVSPGEVDGVASDLLRRAQTG